MKEQALDPETGRAPRRSGTRPHRSRIFPLVYLVDLLFIYIAKFEIYFAADADGLSAEVLAVGNLIVAVIAIIFTTTIPRLSQPGDPA